MLKLAILGGAALAATCMPAAAQSFGVGVEFGYPEPGYYYEAPPVYAAPPPPVFRMMDPDAVFDSLEDRGYRDFGPMALRDGVYKLNAVDRRGDLVALELNVVTAEIMHEFLLAPGHARPAFVAPAYDAPPPVVRTPPPPPAARDPLVVY